MDADISRWVLEFLARQPLGDRFFDSILRVLPVPNADWYRFKKSNLLRMIESEISSGSFSEKLLELFERIEELHFEERVQCSDAMKAAYCSVAVECTLKFLEGNGDDKEWNYFNAINSIWRDRVCGMEKLNRVGLVSKELQSWKDEIEASVSNSNTRHNLYARSKKNDAIKAVRIYLAEAIENSGPSFVELVADKMGHELFRATLPDSARTHLTFGRDIILGQVAEGAVSHNSREMHKKDFLCKHAAPKHYSYGQKMPRTSGGLKIEDSKEFGLETVENQYDLPPTAEVNKGVEALRSSSMKLNASVSDPLPETLELAETVKSSLERENTCHDPMVENCVQVDVDVPNPSDRVDVDATNTPGVNNAEFVCVKEHNLNFKKREDNLGNSCCMRHSKTPKPSLMERNVTAHTYEWDDSIDTTSKKSSDGRGLPLPSPRRKLVSPLKRSAIRKPRRKIKRWSNLEEDTLRAGVRKYGEGNWKRILNSYRDIFDERTEVDLKDKWRNLTY